MAGNRYPAHKVVLAARSSYFRALFRSGMRETNDTKIDLHDISLPAFNILMKYIYCGVFPEHDEAISAEVLQSANFLGLEELIAYLESIIGSTLTVTVRMVYNSRHKFGLSSPT